MGLFSRVYKVGASQLDELGSKIAKRNKKPVKNVAPPTRATVQPKEIRISKSGASTQTVQTSKPLVQRALRNTLVTAGKVGAGTALIGGSSYIAGKGLVSLGGGIQSVREGIFGQSDAQDIVDVNESEANKVGAYTDYITSLGGTDQSSGGLSFGGDAGSGQSEGSNAAQAGFGLGTLAVIGGGGYLLWRMFKKKKSTGSTTSSSSSSVPKVTGKKLTGSAFAEKMKLARQLKREARARERAKKK